MNVDEILTSIGASSGLFILYKIAKILYNKYYINSDCHNVNDKTTEIQITITREDEHHEHHEHHEHQENQDDKKEVEKK